MRNRAFRFPPIFLVLRGAVSLQSARSTIPYEVVLAVDRERSSARISKCKSRGSELSYPDSPIGVASFRGNLSWSDIDKDYPENFRGGIVRFMTKGDDMSEEENNNRDYAVTTAPPFSPASSLGFWLCVSLTITFLPLGYASRYIA